MTTAALARRCELTGTAGTRMASAPYGLADAARLLPPLARKRVELLHAWWRACNAMLSAPGEETSKLTQVRHLTARAIAGDLTGLAGFDALAAVAGECGLSGAQMADVINGQVLTGSRWRPRDEFELLGYAFHAGGAMGVLVMRALDIVEDDGEMLDCASDCGLAVTLRRLAHGLKRGTPGAGKMMPRDWLAQAGVDADQLMQPAHRLQRDAFAVRLLRLAMPYARSARYGMTYLPFRCRWAMATVLVQRRSGGRIAAPSIGLIHALQHGPDPVQVPWSRAALARSISFAERLRPVDASVETAVPVR